MQNEKYIFSSDRCENQNFSKYLNSLQGIRGLATIAIFLFHSGFLLKGSFPVTLFFMLSGFMMYYTKSDLKNYHSFKEWNSKYVLRKLKEFYPIHIVTFFIAIVISIPFVIDTEWIKSAILNVCLLQSVVEKYAMGFNGLAWYLSVTFILYFVSYYLIKIVQKVTKVVPMIGIILILLEIFNQLSSTSNLYLYSNPMYRMLDFLLGMFIASLYKKTKKIYKKIIFGKL